MKKVVFVCLFTFWLAQSKGHIHQTNISIPLIVSVLQLNVTLAAFRWEKIHIWECEDLYWLCHIKHNCMCGCNKKTWCMGTGRWMIVIVQHWETQSCSDSCVMGFEPAPVDRWNGGNTEEISSLRLGGCGKSTWYINQRSILPVGGLWGSTVLTHPFTCFVTSWLFDSIYNIIFNNLLSEWDGLIFWTYTLDWCVFNLEWKLILTFAKSNWHIF